MKKTCGFFFLICLSVQASEISQLPQDLGIDHEARVQSLIETSQATRKMANTRKIANLNAEDRYWANEFDKIMNDDSNKDYLDLCLEL